MYCVNDKQPFHRFIWVYVRLAETITEISYAKQHEESQNALMVHGTNIFKFINEIKELINQFQASLIMTSLKPGTSRILFVKKHDQCFLLHP
jgi:hypothetical protein